MFEMCFRSLTWYIMLVYLTLNNIKTKILRSNTYIHVEVVFHLKPLQMKTASTLI